MSRPLEFSRRALGTFFLGAAVVMVVLGFSLFRERLAGLAFLLYWLLCYLFTVLAIGMAVLEFVAIRRRAQQERQELVRRTFVGLGKSPNEQEAGSDGTRSPGS